MNRHRRPARRGRWGAAAGVAIALAAVAGACDSDSGDASPATTNAADTTVVPRASTSIDTPSATTSAPTAPARTDVTTAPPTSERTVAVASSAPPMRTDPPTTSADGLALPAGDQPDVLGPLGSTDLELTTADGTVRIGAADLPASIPADFPVPPDLEVQLATDTGDEAGFSGVTSVEFDSLVELYRRGLPAAGYELLEDRLVSDSVAVIRFGGPSGTGQVAISTSPGGGRSILVTFER